MKQGTEKKTESKKGKRGAEIALNARRELTKEVIERLKAPYPDTKCTLTCEDAWQLLISVWLAAQCTDLRVDQVTSRLYERFPMIWALSEMPAEDIEEIVRPCGLGNPRVWDIRKCMTVLYEEYQDQVLRDLKALLVLSGVGRKSANLTMGDVFGEPAVVTDTHCTWLVSRIGLVDQVKEPAKVEKLLRELVPPEENNQFCHRPVDYGRVICTARKPDCGYCVLNDLCRYAKEEQPSGLGELREGGE